MNSYDIILDVNEALQQDVTGMDVMCGDGGNKQIMYIMVAAPGHYKEFPTIGVNIFSFLNAVTTESALQKIIKTQMEADIFKNPQIDTSQFLLNGIVIVNRTQVNLQ